MMYYLQGTQPMCANQYLQAQHSNTNDWSIDYYTYRDTQSFSRNAFIKDTYLRESRSEILAFCILPSEYQIC